MNKLNIQKLLHDYDETNVNIFINYIDKLATEKRNGNLKNAWMGYKTDEQLASMFKQVNKDGLAFDGKIVSLQTTGISYSYMAYKNKMLIAYPESIIDTQLVYKDDGFKCEKKNGKVLYEHVINNPFSRNEVDVIGGYCVIKNNRGEFLTLLSVKDMEKHRKVAKTDYIWKAWLIEMYKKTLMKKSCKQHFQDIFVNIETIDNENNYDIDLPLGLDVQVKGDIEAITTMPDLETYYHKNKDKNKLHAKDFNKLISRQKKLLGAKK
jgi:hypothetical protein